MTTPEHKAKWKEQYRKRLNDFSVSPYHPCKYCQSPILRHWKYCERPECIIEHRKERETRKSMNRLESLKERIKKRDEKRKTVPTYQDLLAEVKYLRGMIRGTKTITNDNEK